MAETISLWDKIVKKFKNSWLGVFILAVSVLFYFLKDVRKDWQETADRKIAMEKEGLRNAMNKRLELMIDSIILRITRNDIQPDTLCQFVEKYISVRKSLGLMPNQIVVEKEFALKKKLFDYAHKIWLGLREVWLNPKESDLDESQTKVSLKHLCNKILAFCEFTSTCSTSETEIIRITKDEIEKN